MKTLKEWNDGNGDKEIDSKLKKNTPSLLARQIFLPYSCFYPYSAFHILTHGRTSTHIYGQERNHGLIKIFLD